MGGSGVVPPEDAVVGRRVQVKTSSTERKDVNSTTLFEVVEKLGWLVS